MELNRCAFCVFLLMNIAQAARTYTTDPLVDLTTSLKTNVSMTWIGFPYGYERLDMVKAQDNDLTIEAYGFKMAIHTGTHMDAPCHVRVNENAYRMHEIPLNMFFGPAAVMDIKEKVDGYNDYELSLEDVQKWEEMNGKVPEGAIVLVHTGWSKRFDGDQEKYYGTLDTSKPELLSFPGVHKDAARFLVEERNINAIGLDAGSPDAGKTTAIDSERNQVHRIVLGNNKIIIENVGPDLGLLPPTGYNIHAIPMKLYDTCGAPLRLLAFKTPPSASVIVEPAMWILVLAAMLGVTGSGQ